MKMQQWKAAAIGALQPNPSLDEAQQNGRHLGLKIFATVLLLISIVYVLHSLMIGQFLLLPNGRLPLFVVGFLITSSPTLLSHIFGISLETSNTRALLLLLPLFLLALVLNGSTALNMICVGVVYLRLALPRHLAWRYFLSFLIGLAPTVWYMKQPIDAMLLSQFVYIYVLIFVLLDIALSRAGQTYQQHCDTLFNAVVVVSASWFTLKIIFALVSSFSIDITMELFNVGVIIIVLALRRFMSHGAFVKLWVALVLVSVQAGFSLQGVSYSPMAWSAFVVVILVLQLRWMVVYWLALATMFMYFFLVTLAGESADDSYLVFFGFAVFLTNLYLFFVLGCFIPSFPLASMVQRLVQEFSSADFQKNFLLYLGIGLFISFWPLAFIYANQLFSVTLMEYLVGWGGYFWWLGMLSIIIVCALILALRDADLAQLTQLTYESEQYDRSKTALLSVIGREMRTPLSNLLLLLNKMHAVPLMASDMRHYVATMKKSGESMNALMGNITDISAIELGELLLKEKPVSLHSLLANILVNTQALASDMKVVVHSDLAPETNTTILVDGQRLTQVLSNLMTNAIKFSANGNVWLKVYVDQGEVVFSIKDDGQGMDEATLAKVFERFEQADKGLARKHQGLGLGLSLSAELVELMQGSLTASSQLGVGSEFICCIPFKEGSQIEVSGDLKTVHGDLQSCRVLVVEDDDVSREILLGAIENDVAQTMAARNGFEALDIIHNQDVDMVLTDIAMPQMNGVELLHAIRQASYAVPAIALTGNALSSDIEYYKQQGFDAVLTKPLNLDALLAAMNAALIKQEESGDD